MESLTPAQQVIKIVNDELTELMGGSEAARIHIKSKPPTVIAMCGLQVRGKTNAYRQAGQTLYQRGHRPLLAGMRYLLARRSRSAEDRRRKGRGAGVQTGW